MKDPKKPEELLLAFFYQDDENLAVMHARLPDPKAVACELYFNGLRELFWADQPRSRVHSDPVYDYNKDEIVWAIHAKNRPSDWRAYDSVIEVWRIGKHFSLDGIDRVGGHRDPSDDRQHSRSYGLVPSSREHIPSIVVESNIISASVIVQGDDGGGPKIRLVQHRDYKWTTVPCNGGFMHEDQYYPHDKMFSYSGPSAASGINHVYHVQHAWGGNNKTLRLNTIKSNNFLDLNRDNGLRWQRHEIETDLDNDQVLTHVFTHGSEKHHLMFMHLKPNAQAVVVSALPLEEDGYPDYKGATFAGQILRAIRAKHLIVDLSNIAGSTPIKDGTSRNLCAFEYHGNLLLLWSSNGGHSCIVGQLDDDGLIASDCKWRSVDVKFAQLLWKTQAGIFNTSGVIVPSSFVWV